MYFYITILYLTRVIFNINCSQYVQSLVIDNNESEKYEDSNIISSHKNGKPPKLEDSRKLFSKIGNDSKKLKYFSYSPRPFRTAKSGRKRTPLPTLNDSFYRHLHRQQNLQNNSEQIVFNMRKGSSSPVKIIMDYDSDAYIINFKNEGDKENPNRKMTEKPKFKKGNKGETITPFVKDETEDYITIEKVIKDPEANENSNADIGNTNNVKVFSNNVYIYNSKHKGDTGSHMFQYENKFRNMEDIGKKIIEKTIKNLEKVRNRTFFPFTYKKPDYYTDKRDVYKNRDEKQFSGKDAYIDYSLKPKTNSKKNKYSNKKMSLQIPVPTLHDSFYRHLHRQQNLQNNSEQIVFNMWKGSSSPVKIIMDYDSDEYIIEFKNKGDKENPNRKVREKPKFKKGNKGETITHFVKDETEDYITTEKVIKDPKANENLNDDSDNTNSVEVFNNKIYIQNSKHKGDTGSQYGNKIRNMENIAKEIIEKTIKNLENLKTRTFSQNTDKETNYYKGTGDVYKNRDEEQFNGKDAYIGIYNLESNSNSKKNKYYNKKMSLQIPEFSYQIDEELQKLLAKKSGLKGDQVQGISFQNYIATLMRQQLKKLEEVQSNNEEVSPYRRRFKTK